jgi:hypothetical protein
MPNLSLFRDNIFGLQNNADYIKSLQNQPIVEVNPMAPELQAQAQPDTAVLEGIMALVQAMQAKEQVGISDVETYPDYIPEEVRFPDVEGFPSDLPPEIQTPDIETFPDYAPGIGDKEGMPDTVPEEVQMGDVEGFPADLPEEVRTPDYQSMDTDDKAKAEVGAGEKEFHEMTQKEFNNIPIIKYITERLSDKVNKLKVDERNQLATQLVDMGLMKIEDFNAMTGQHGFGGEVTGVKNLSTDKPIPSKPVEGDIGAIFNYIGQWQTFTNIPLFAHRDAITKALVEGKNVPKEIIDSYDGWKFPDINGEMGTLKEAVESYGGTFDKTKAEVGGIGEIKASLDDKGNFTMSGDVLTKKLSTLKDEEIIDLMRWARTQSAHTKRNVEQTASAELRSRGVPVDQIEWQIKELGKAEVGGKDK